MIYGYVRVSTQEQSVDSQKNNVANKVLITIFSMLAELERDFISERTK